MIYNLEQYEPFIKGILKKIPLIRTPQLELFLKKSFENIDDDLAFEILLSIQRRGYVYLSIDGWAMTKGMYQRITNDRLNKYVHIYEESFRLDKMEQVIKRSGVLGDEIDCLWLAIDMLPQSINFVSAPIPWSIMFEIAGKDNEQGRLFQITKIAEGNEFARCELLKSLPRIEDENVRNAVRRIAIIENEDHAFMVPHIGFTHICKLDHRLSRHYKLIERRTGSDIWGE